MAPRGRPGRRCVWEKDIGEVASGVECPPPHAATQPEVILPCLLSSPERASLDASPQPVLGGALPAAPSPSTHLAPHTSQGWGRRDGRQGRGELRAPGYRPMPSDSHSTSRPPQDRDNSPSSCAGLFIASHIGFDWPGVWVHLDIAAPVHAVSAGAPPRGCPLLPLPPAWSPSLWSLQSCRLNSLCVGALTMAQPPASVCHPRSSALPNPIPDPGERPRPPLVLQDALTKKGGRVGRPGSPTDTEAPMFCFCPQGERATGFGVALLLALFGRASEDPLLNLVSPLGCDPDLQEGDVGRDSKRRRLV